MNDISIVPLNLGFGCVSQGFIYNLSLNIINTSNISQKFRISIDDNDSNGNKLLSSYNGSKSIAPGLSIQVILELRTYKISYSNFNLTIYQSEFEKVLQKSITALVVSVNDYKYLKMYFKLNNKPVLSNNVTIKSSLMINDKSIHSQSTMPSVYSEILLDDDDMDELEDLPMISQTYWDPYCNLLKLDDILSNTIVTSEISLEESINKTNELRNNRYTELEDQGYYTERVVERLNSQRRPKVPQINTNISYSSNNGNSPLISPITATDRNIFY